jgi:hypothetical protein
MGNACDTYGEVGNERRIFMEKLEDPGLLEDFKMA